MFVLFLTAQKGIPFFSREKLCRKAGGGDVNMFLIGAQPKNVFSRFEKKTPLRPIFLEANQQNTHPAQPALAWNGSSFLKSKQVYLFSPSPASSFWPTKKAHTVFFSLNIFRFFRPFFYFSSSVLRIESPCAGCGRCLLWRLGPARRFTTNATTRTPSPALCRRCSEGHMWRQVGNLEPRWLWKWAGWKKNQWIDKALKVDFFWWKIRVLFVVVQVQLYVILGFSRVWRWCGAFWEERSCISPWKHEFVSGWGQDDGWVILFHFPYTVWL